LLLKISISVPRYRPVRAGVYKTT